MEEKLKVVLLGFLSLVVFVSGCVEGEGMESIFSSFSTQQEVVVAPNDVLEIENEKIIPDPPITADSPFKLVMSIVNVGEASEGVKEAKNVKTVVYDHGICSLETDATVNHGSIYPGGGTGLAEFEFRAPVNRELGYMSRTCTIRYYTEFKYDAYTTSDIVMISRERAEEMSRTGETPEISPVQTQSRGPLKIEVNFDVKQPVYEDLVIPMIVKVKNVGDGTFNTLTTPPALTIELPPQLKVISCTPSSWFAGGGISHDVPYHGTAIDIITTETDIPLINKETPPIRCDLKLKDGVAINDLTTLTVRAKIVGYRYRIYGEKDVSINPTYEAKP